MNILRKKNDSDTKYQYCSSDTFTRVSNQLIDLKNMDLQYTEAGKEVELFYNEPLNRLLLRVYKLFFAEKGNHILDHDHTNINVIVHMARSPWFCRNSSEFIPYLSRKYPVIIP